MLQIPLKKKKKKDSKDTCIPVQSKASQMLVAWMIVTGQQAPNKTHTACPFILMVGQLPIYPHKGVEFFFFFLVNVFLNLRDLDMFHVNLKFSKCFISASKMLKMFHLNFIVSYCFIKTLGFWISFIQTFYFYFYFFL